MDGLISILIICGIAAISSSAKKKKQMQKAAQKQQAFSDMIEMESTGKAAVSKEKVLKLLKEEAQEGVSQKEIAEKAAPVQLKMDILQAQPVKPIVKAKPAPVLFMENDEPEGSVSTQGESAEEHARHRQKMLAEEAHIRSVHEELQEIRNMNLNKLRSAVVMSEILDKPVSLRTRRRF